MPVIHKELFDFEGKLAGEPQGEGRQHDRSLFRFL